jgi:NAD(P)H-hydrate epimerase
VDIGIPKEAERGIGTELLGTPWVRERLPARAPGGNKGTFGKVLVVAGSRNYVGAARLTAEAAYRTGAGIVTIGCPASMQPVIAPSIAEATWLPLADDDGLLAASAADAVLDALGGYDVLAIGPGLGSGGGVRDVIGRVLSRLPGNVRGAVVDADALNALAASPGWQDGITTPLVLTPHPGEMARLLASDVETVQADRLNVAVRAAADWRQVVVLKGAHTIVADQDGRAAVSPWANPLLATAGTGDVLAGAIAGLLAQGMAPFEAAACGVYVHAMAAEELADDFAGRGMLASELLPALPRALRTIIAGKPARPMSGGPADLAGFAGGAGFGGLAPGGRFGEPGMA